MNYVSFNPATGRIHQKGFTDVLPLETLGLNHLQINHAAYETLNTANVYVKNGVLVEIPTRLSPHHAFNYTTKQWDDPRTLQDHQKAKWSQIKQARTQAEYAGFTWDDSTFDSDATSQNRITGAVTLAQMSAAFSIEWILKDNTVCALNQAGMLQVGAALGAHVAMQFARGVLLRGRIEAATTREMVEAVGWDNVATI